MESRKCSGPCKRNLELNLTNYRASKVLRNKGFRWDCRQCAHKHRKAWLKAHKRTPGPAELFGKVKRNARARGIELSLTKEQYMELTNANCFYCETEKSGHRMGLDRVDNTKGYTESNVVPCCQPCNYKKKDLSFQDIEMFYNKLTARERGENQKLWKSTYSLTREA